MSCADPFVSVGRPRKRKQARHSIAKRGKRLEYFTIAWNTLEGVVSIIAGAIAGSISLVGFGLDSFIEVASGATLLWRMSMDSDESKRERNEKLSLRIVGLSFLALAAYIAFESIGDLLERKRQSAALPESLLPSRRW